MTMPKMGESITEGTIQKWLKKPGDILENDETILEISTDKVDSEIPTPAAGTLLEIISQEGETIDVGEVIAIIEAEGSAVNSEETKKPEVAEKVADDIAEPVDKNEMPRDDKSTKIKSNRFYSPLVMNIAAKNSISFEELDGIAGSGLNGRVTKKDIYKYLESGMPQKTKTAAKPVREIVYPLPENGIEILPMDNMRKKIAEHMIHSKQTSAHVNLYTEVDMHSISRIRDRNKDSFKQKEGFSLTYMPFIIEATVNALKEFPLLNARIDGDNIIKQNFFNIGIAVAVDNGLIVPNIFNSDEKNLVGLARAINDIAGRARNKKLKPDELANGTFSISNFGVYGTTIGFPIINQPQVAILGVGAIKKRPVVIDDAIAIRPVMYLALTIDHRLIDGAMGSQFLEKIRILLEDYNLNMKI